MAKPVLVRSASGHIADGSVAYNAALDCAGANMLVVTVKHTGTTSLRHDAPTIGGTAMSLLGGSHPTNTHTRVWYVLNPPQSSVTVVIPAYQSISNKGFILEAFSGVSTAAPLRELAAITADNPFGALLATAAARDTTSFPITIPSAPTDGLIATQAYLGHTSTRTWVAGANTPIHQQRINSYPFAAATNAQGAGADVTIPWSFETVHTTGDANTVAFVLNGAASPLTAGVTSSTSVNSTLTVSGADGTVFAVAVGPTGSATEPTGPQIEAGTDGADVAAIPGSTPVTAAGDIDVALTGLTANSVYTVYAVHKAADGTYGPVTSTTVTPNPVLAGTLETGANTPYADGGSWLIGILNADMTGITTATVTPDANGAISIVDALLPLSTEVVIASIAPDGTNGVIGKLTTSA